MSHCVFIWAAILFIANVMLAQLPNWVYSNPSTQESLFTCIAAWNADNDAKVELAACTYYYDIDDPYQSGGYVYLLTTNAMGSLVLDNGWISTNRACYQVLKWADVNGDGYTDLVAGTSLMVDENTPVLCFLNQGGTLSTTAVPLVTSQAWDVMSLEWGDFNFDGLPDLLIVRTDGPPMILPGQATASAWTVIGSTPVELEISSNEERPRVVNRAMDSDVWDVNSDGFLDIVLSSHWATCELQSNYTESFYEVKTIGRGADFSEAVAYVPAATSPGRVSVLRGNAWDSGVANVYDFAINTFIELLPDVQYFNVEYVSDFSLVSLTSSFQPQLLLAVAEVGSQDTSTDPRFRRGRVLRLDRTLASWSAFDLWKELDQARPEAYSVTWCDLTASTAQYATYRLFGSDHLYNIGGHNQFAYHIPVYGIIDAYYMDNNGIAVQVQSWYSGNGWFGIKESIPSGCVPFVVVQTASTPDLFFGRRGSVEGYNR
jgi:hypothetical protein